MVCNQSEDVANFHRVLKVRGRLPCTPLTNIPVPEGESDGPVGGLDGLMQKYPDS